MTPKAVAIRMHGREKPNTAQVSGSHQAAAEAFVDRALSRCEGAIEELIIFGSTARNEAQGLASDVDVLVVLADDADRTAVSDELHAISYDVMIEYGPVVELHVLSATEFDAARSDRDPFIHTVVQEGLAYI